MKAPISFQDILDSTTNGVVATDTQGNITYVNKTAEQILDVSASEQGGRFICDVLPSIGSHVMECLRVRKSNLGQQVAGEHGDLILNISLIENEGLVRGTVCNFQELKSFESTAKELHLYKRLHEQLQAIFKASFDGIWVCDGEGTVISINEASERLNGIKAHKVVGETISKLVAEGLFDRSVTQRVLKARKQISLVQHVKRTKRSLLVTGTPVFDENGRISLVVVNERDMTDLNTMRQQLEQDRLVYSKMKEELAELSMLELNREGIVGTSESMRQVIRVALKLARLEASNILILGESGTGKGLVAKYIHQSSDRKHQPFIQVNCAALPEHLLEAELFGYEKGAFTGAREQGKAGLFELAHGGSLFLDEIGDMPLPLQAKLLKCLDDHEIMRLGGTKAKKIDCLVIAATNQDLEQRVRAHDFRPDLFYRLSSFRLKIPPLRERGEDIFELAHHFVSHYNNRYGMRKRLSSDGLRALQNYSFPGNVRELKNIIKQAVVLSEVDVIDHFLRDLLQRPGREEISSPSPRKSGSSLVEQLQHVERQLLIDTMARCRNTRELAAELGISQSTVVRKMRRHGLRFNTMRSRITKDRFRMPVKDLLY